MSKQVEVSAVQNRLLDRSCLPRFDRIEPEHVVPGIRALLAELEAEFQALEEGCEAITCVGADGQALILS